MHQFSNHLKKGTINNVFSTTVSRYFSMDCIDAADTTSRLASSQHNRSQKRKAQKRPHYLTHSHCNLKNNGTTFKQYNTFETDKKTTHFTESKNNFSKVNSPLFSLPNSDSNSTTSSKYASVDTFSQDLETQQAKTKNYDDNNNLFKEQIGSVLKPTDQKLATKFFGNKGVRQREKSKRLWLIHPRSTIR